MLAMARTVSFAVFALVAALLPAAARAQAKPADEGPKTGVHWRNRPSFQFGDVRIDLRLKLQFDWRAFDPDIEEDTYDFRVHRGGINGEIGNHVEFQIERDLNSDGKWRDVFAHWQTFRQLEVTAGRFKVPFGREELVSSTDVDFAFRSLVSTAIPPARDTGVMVHGRFLRRGFTYEAGVFDGDGDNGRLEEAQFSRDNEPVALGHSFAGRITATPLRPLAKTFQDFRLGFAYGQVDVPEGLNSLRGETVYGTEEFFEPVYVKGRRSRVGTEASYTPGPVGFEAEWMRAYEQRKEQGLGDVDLSDLITTGYYASATWLVTGEDKAGFNRPRRSLFAGGFGALEFGARFEKLGFESAEKVGPAFRNPRAEHILENSDKVWTIGVNWFPNRWVRVTVNAIHEEFEDARRTPIPGTTEFWSGLGRLQIVF
jgi:phosphate-selective porin OprO/OprP